jgi:membrane protein required for colicin V production
MNMVDIFLMVIIGISAFMGLKIGLIRAGFAALGVFVGSVLGGQLSDDIGRLYSGIDSDSVVATAISYAIIITVCLTVAAIASVIVRKVLNLLLMGWADKLAGGALGVAAGAVIAAGIIMGMANLTYGPEVGDDLAAKVLNSTLDSDKAKKRLEGGLTHSSFVKRFLDVVEVVPSSALWFVPSNFKDSLDVLSQRRSTVRG